MKLVLKIVGIGLLVLIGLPILAFLIVPFLIPVPPLENIKPVEDLVDPDSRFLSWNGLQVHYKQAGSGKPLILLLHGFGASEYSWREVIDPLAEIGTVAAYDRPAFGLTSRPMPGEWNGPSPYGLDAQADLAVAMMDQFGAEKAILIGNSAGGQVALYTALKYPDRVQALVLVDAAVYGDGPIPSWARFLLFTPQMDRVGPLLARAVQGNGNDIIRTAWHDPSKVTDEIIQNYRKPLQMDNWDRALWELTKANEPTYLYKRFNELKMPVLVVTGDDDRIVATELSIRLGGEIPGAKLVVFSACGHVPQEECPDQFLQAVQPFLLGLP
ncbi:MAG TPA: alpha/beta hydrolase [Anaerolineaceae bacterium]|nr:alpha/beta hydrolase [Anaerolineaceae bacterium]